MDRAEEIRTETESLLKADRVIERGRTRLFDQQALLSGLQTHGHPTREAERLVDLMQQTLWEWERHRLLIRQRLAYLKNRSIPDVTEQESDAPLNSLPSSTM